MKFLRYLCTFNINIFPIGSYLASVPIIYMSSMRNADVRHGIFGKTVIKELTTKEQR